jgi:DNA-binding NtrC family response regulator
MNRIMVVDDEDNILRALRRVLSGNDQDVELFSNPHEALRRVQVAIFDLIISDYRMPDMDGVHFLCEVKKLQPESMRIIISGHADMQGLLGAINEAEIFRFVRKPWDDYDLQATVQNALLHRSVLVENRRLADQVRRQREILHRQSAAIRKLETRYPGLTKVNWGVDGSVVMEEDDM